MPKKKSYEDKWQRGDRQPFAQGGNGRAFKVTPVDGDNTHTHVLKELKDNKDPVRRHRFKTEVAALRKLNHPLVAKVVDDNMDDYADLNISLYFVSEFAGDCSLEQFIKSITTMPQDEAVLIVMALLNTLAYCHSANIIHRDIKPDNIILDKDRQPILIDFGQSFDADEDSGSLTTSPGEHLGNRFLLLPELRTSDGGLNDKRDPRSDVTCCAGILFYLLTGLPPTTLLDGNGNLPHQREKPRDIINSIGEPMRTRLLRIFDKAFQYAIDHRYQSSDELRLDLVRLSLPPSTPDSDDLSSALQLMRDAGDYKLRQHKSEILEKMSEALTNAVGQVRDGMLKGKFQTLQTGHHIDIERLTFTNTFGVFDKVKPEIKIVPTFNVGFVGSELVATASFNDETEELFRCPVATFTVTHSYQDAVRAYFQRKVTQTIISYMG